MKDYIGLVIKPFESGTRGSLSLVQSGNDWGLSCGSYQLTLRYGNCINFLKKYFPTQSKSLYFNKSKEDIAKSKYPGEDYCSSPDEVKEVWIKCYNLVGVDRFFEYEHEYIRITYYEPLLKKISKIFNPNKHSRMAQECVWSWAVHKGVTGAYNGIKECCQNIDAQSTKSKELLDIFYNYRYKVNKLDRYRAGISSKISERETLRQICKIYPLPYNGTLPSDGTRASGIDAVTNKKYTEPTKVLSYGSKGEGVKWIQHKLILSGYDKVTYKNEKGQTIIKRVEIDGIFGSITLQAVKQFQSANNITVDGKVGAVTRRFLKLN